MSDDIQQQSNSSKYGLRARKPPDYYGFAMADHTYSNVRYVTTVEDGYDDDVSNRPSLVQTESFHMPSLGDDELQIPQLQTSDDQLIPSDQLNQITQLTCSIIENKSNVIHGMNAVTPQFPPQNFELPSITESNSVTSNNPADNTVVHGQNVTITLPLMESVGDQHDPMSRLPPPAAAPNRGRHLVGPDNGMSLSQQQLQHQLQQQHSRGVPIHLSSQMFYHPSRGPGAAGQQTSPPSSSSSPNSEATEDSDDNQDSKKRKKGTKKRKKKDPNEPQKPISAYALFFRDRQAAIKSQNPQASFGEVSKIVASMWDSLDAEQKQEYKRRTEQAKKEYLKKLAEYRANQVSKSSESDNAPPLKQMSPPRHTTPTTTNYPPCAPVNITHNTNIPSAITPLPSSVLGLRPIAPKPLNSLGGPTINTTHDALQQQQGGTMANMNIVFDGKMQINSNMIGCNSMSLLKNTMCVRAGCNNAAIDSSDWDNEYCSNRCVVDHCRDVFASWVANRNPNSIPYTPVT